MPALRGDAPAGSAGWERRRLAGNWARGRLAPGVGRTLEATANPWLGSSPPPTRAARSRPAQLPARCRRSRDVSDNRVRRRMAAVGIRVIPVEDPFIDIAAVSCRPNPLAAKDPTGAVLFLSHRLPQPAHSARFLPIVSPHQYLVLVSSSPAPHIPIPPPSATGTPLRSAPRAIQHRHSHHSSSRRPPDVLPAGRSQVCARMRQRQPVAASLRPHTPSTQPLFRHLSDSRCSARTYETRFGSPR
jgi:hypothetical protein